MGGLQDQEAHCRTEGRHLQSFLLGALVYSLAGCSKRGSFKATGAGCHISGPDGRERQPAWARGLECNSKPQAGLPAMCSHHPQPNMESMLLQGTLLCQPGNAVVMAGFCSSGGKGGTWALLTAWHRTATRQYGLPDRFLACKSTMIGPQQNMIRQHACLQQFVCTCHSLSMNASGRRRKQTKWL